MLNLHPPTAGTLAQLVEQRTENPCVPGSIPGGTTNKKVKTLSFNELDRVFSLVVNRVVNTLQLSSFFLRLFFNSIRSKDFFFVETVCPRIKRQNCILFFYQFQLLQYLFLCARQKAHQALAKMT